MTRYYLYIKTGVVLNQYSQFYKVAIGESAQEVRTLAWLESYAFEHGHFFVLWSVNAADFYLKCIQSVGMSRSSLVRIKGSMLKRSLQTGDEEPAAYNAALSRHRMMKLIDPGYYASCQISLKASQ